MSIPTLEARAEPTRATSFIWLLLAGVLIGILFLLAVQVEEKKWFFFLFLGVLVFSASLTPANKKDFYLALLVLAIPLRADLHLYLQRVTTHHTTLGFIFLLHYLPLAALFLLWAGRCLLEHSGLGISSRGLIPLAGFFFFAFISVLVGGNTLFGAFDLFALMGSIVLFIYASSELRTKHDLHLVVTLLMVTVVIQSIIAIGQHVTNSSLGLEILGAYMEPWGESIPLTRVGGTIGHPNALAMYFDLLLPLGVALLFAPLARRTRFFLGITVALGIYGLTLTLSRAGLVSSVAASLFVLFVWLKKRIGMFRALVALMLIIMLVLAPLILTSNPVQKRFLKDDYRMAFGRIPLLEVALNIIKDRPFFGAGLNNYTKVAMKYDKTPQWVTSVWNMPVHNLYLFILAEIGLFGLTFYIIFILITFSALLPAIRSPDAFLSWASLGIACGLAAFFTHVLVEIDSVTRNSSFWFILGLAVSVGRLGARFQPVPRKHNGEI